MTGSRLALVGLLGAAALAGCSTSGGTTAAAPAPAAAAVTAEATGKGALARTDAVMVTATVVAIDQATRKVTLRGPEGQEITFRADESVRNLSQVKPGDVVEAAYYQSVAVQVKKPGQATPGVSAGSALERAEPGEKPGGTALQSITVTSTVEAIDRSNQTVTLKDADGALTTVAVKNPAHLEGVEVGDLVEITYTEALAISVDEP